MNNKMNNKLLVVLEKKDHVDKAINLISKQENYLIVALDPDIQYELKRRGIAYVIPEDYIGDRDYSKLINFSDKWYEPIKKHFAYDCFSLLELAKIVFLEEFTEIFISIDILTNAIKREKPSKILIFKNYENNDLLFRIAFQISKKKKIKVSFISDKKKVEIKKLNSFMNHFLSKLQNLDYNIRSNNFGKQKNRILLIGSYRQVDPICRILKRNKNNIIIRAGDTFGRSLFKKNVDYYINFKYFNTTKIKKRIKLLKRRILFEWDRLSKNLELNKKLVYQNVRLLDLIINNKCLINKLLDVVRYIETTKYILNRDKIDIIVLINDVLPFEKSVVKVADKFDIPSLVIQHGLCSSYNPVGYLPLSATKMAVWGDYSRKWMINRGVDENRLVITGAPFFDRYFYRKPGKDVYTELKIDRCKKIVLYTLECSPKNVMFIKFLILPNQHKKRISAIFNTFKNLPDLFLVIKVHPSVKDSSIIDIASEETGFKNYKVVYDIDIYNLLSISDLVITSWSTVGLEAILLGKPLMIINFYGNVKDPIGFAKKGVAIAVDKPSDLKKTINSMLTDLKLQKSLGKGRRRFIRLYNYKHDGKASERVVKLIKTIKRKHL